MIILITGVPGSGKTLYLISQFLNGQFKDRPKYVNNIKNLLIEHEVLSGDEDTPAEDSDVLNWYDGRVPTGAVIVIDEVQRIWRPRSSTAKVPKHVAELETHRHKGLDFVIITQHPQLLDANVRRLVGRHIHMRRTWGRQAAMVYEWDHCSANVQATKMAQAKFWVFDKKAYKLYKSSELHTKAGGRIPLILKFAALLCIAAPLIWWKTGKQMYARFSGETYKMEESTSSVENNLMDTSTFSNRSKDEPMTREEYIQSFKPRIEYFQHSAVRYDELTKPVKVPIPAACLKMEKKPCKCFTQDGTPYPTDKNLCNQIVENGMFIDFQAEKNKQSVKPVQQFSG